jgi:hypothetical protein
MEWNRNRPLGLILDEEAEEVIYNLYITFPLIVSNAFMNKEISVLTQSIEQGININCAYPLEAPFYKQHCKKTFRFNKNNIPK